MIGALNSAPLDGRKHGSYDTSRDAPVRKLAKASHACNRARLGNVEQEIVLDRFHVV